MKQIILITINLLIFCSVTSAQYKVTKRTTLLCDLPECLEEYESSADSSTLGFASDRSLGNVQAKGGSSNSENTQNVFFIETLNSILFIPQSFIPIESKFSISGAIQNIIKVQIYNSSKELVFQTHVIDNAWNGVWKGVPQYGVFNYKLTVKVGEDSTEVIEGLIVTKKSN